MAIDSTREVRRVVLAALKADLTLSTLIPDGQIYGQEIPIGADGKRIARWPFVQVGSIFGVPIRATCIDGSQLEGAVHGYSKGFQLAGAAYETAEDHASRIGEAIAVALDGQRIPIAFGHVSIRWTGPRLIADASDAFHTIQGFRYRCITNLG